MLAGLISMQYIGTKDQIADIFTKALGQSQHHYLAGMLRLCDLFRPIRLKGSVEDSQSDEDLKRDIAEKMKNICGKGQEIKLTT